MNACQSSETSADSHLNNFIQQCVYSINNFDERNSCISTLSLALEHLLSCRLYPVSSLCFDVCFQTEIVPILCCVSKTRNEVFGKLLELTNTNGSLCSSTFSAKGISFDSITLVSDSSDILVKFNGFQFLISVNNQSLVYQTLLFDDYCNIFGDIFKKSFVLIRGWLVYEFPLLNRSSDSVFSMEVVFIILSAIFCTNEDIKSPLHGFQLFLETLVGIQFNNVYITAFGIIERQSSALSKLSKMGSLCKSISDIYYRRLKVPPDFVDLPLDNSSCREIDTSTENNSKAYVESFLDSRVDFLELDKFVHDPFVVIDPISRRNITQFNSFLGKLSLKSCHDAIKRGKDLLNNFFSCKTMDRDVIKSAFPTLSEIVDLCSLSISMAPSGLVPSPSPGYLNNLLLDSELMILHKISPRAIANLAFFLLQHCDGPQTVGEIGKMIQDYSKSAELMKIIKINFKGLKRILSSFPGMFRVGEEHSFNPLVQIVASVTLNCSCYSYCPSVVNLLYNGPSFRSIRDAVSLLIGKEINLESNASKETSFEDNFSSYYSIDNLLSKDLLSDDSPMNSNQDGDSVFDSSSSDLSFFLPETPMSCFTEVHSVSFSGVPSHSSVSLDSNELHSRLSRLCNSGWENSSSNRLINKDSFSSKSSSSSSSHSPMSNTSFVSTGDDPIEKKLSSVFSASSLDDGRLRTNTLESLTNSVVSDFDEPIIPFESDSFSIGRPNYGNLSSSSSAINNNSMPNMMNAMNNSNMLNTSNRTLMAHKSFSGRTSREEPQSVPSMSRNNAMSKSFNFFPESSKTPQISRDPPLPVKKTPAPGATIVDPVTGAKIYNPAKPEVWVPGKFNNAPTASASPSSSLPNGGMNNPNSASSSFSLATSKYPNKAIRSHHYQSHGFEGHGDVQCQLHDNNSNSNSSLSRANSFGLGNSKPQTLNSYASEPILVYSNRAYEPVSVSGETLRRTKRGLGGSFNNSSAPSGFDVVGVMDNVYNNAAVADDRNEIVSHFNVSPNSSGIIVGNNNSGPNSIAKGNNPNNMSVNNNYPNLVRYQSSERLNNNSMIQDGFSPLPALDDPFSSFVPSIESSGKDFSQLPDFLRKL